MFDTDYVEIHDSEMFYDLIEWEKGDAYTTHLVESDTLTLGSDSYMDQFTLTII